jgi:hypothetical protein
MTQEDIAVVNSAIQQKQVIEKITSKLKNPFLSVEEIAVLSRKLDYANCASIYEARKRGFNV